MLKNLLMGTGYKKTPERSSGSFHFYDFF